MLQHREKNACTRDFLRQAFLLRRIASDYGIPFIINDRVDVALACEADGVHLGQEDMECALARRLTGPDMILGVSVSTPDEAVEAEAAGADYLGVGPIFSTPTKPDAVPAIGLEMIETIRRRVRLPLVAIGGINQANAGEIIRRGADGIAVVSAIIAAPEPRDAARRLGEIAGEELRGSAARGRAIRAGK